MQVIQKEVALADGSCVPPSGTHIKGINHLYEGSTKTSGRGREKREVGGREKREVGGRRERGEVQEWEAKGRGR